MDSRSILVIDNEERMCEILKACLESDQVEVDVAFDGEQGFKQFQTKHYDLVITDLKMPKITGLELLDKIKENSRDTDVILMTAFATAQTAVEAMKRGAYDYLIKPFDMEELRLRVDRLLDNKRLVTENRDLRRQLKTRYNFDNITGNSGKMQDVFKLVEKICNGDTTILIRGESGTGKELIALAIHQNSSRADEPFIAVNCGAIPENLLESELFGHEKGAFTGADRIKKGKFEIAGKGIIFLDEIGDLSPSLQVKLLRVLQTKKFERLGANESISLEARILAATHRNLEDALKEGSFREDLYYRINVFPIFLPPLRERREDLPELVDHFIKNFSKDKAITIEPTALESLINYDWPGNVRELENAIERATILCGDQSISKEHFPLYIHSQKPVKGFSELPDKGINLDEHERELIYQAITKSQGNKSKAANLLGITRRKLYSMMDRLGVKELINQ
ncbi:sigma-54-dependent Fis family transcriptional regulator [candidate division KSB1 bacterium]|nr:sigma-54-dependent Fis family transcriptional regulator [candidate division KSB1 bacterium]